MVIPEKIPTLTAYQKALNAYDPSVYPAHKKITAEEWNALMLSLFAQGNRQEDYLELIINEHLPDFVETINEAIDSLEDHELRLTVTEALFHNYYDKEEVDGLLDGKVNKEAGKGLSTNDLTNNLKTAYDEAVNKKHEHSNKAILDSTNAVFTTTLKTSYDDANTKKHTHSNKTILDATTASYTTDEKSKLATLESSHFRGQYLSKTALDAAVPSGNVGDYAYVDSGAGFPVQKYLWDSSDNEWVPAASEGGEETPASIKHKYESNPDTNAYTDADKAKVANALVANGDDIKDTVTTFSEAGTRVNIATGEKTSTIFGKIKKWFTDLKPHAFVNPSTIAPLSSAAASNEKVYSEKLTYDEFANRTFYDIIIKTQAQFNAMLASPTWFDAVSVAFVGQFTLSTPGNSGVQIPATVKQIHGFNSAKITITNFEYSGRGKGGLWYATAPTTQDYSIRDLEVSCTGTTEGYGFHDCSNLSNCTGTGIGTLGYGFRECSNLSNCTGTGMGTTRCYGFSVCNNLSNCTGTGTGTLGYGFAYIDYATNCKDGGSSTAMWTGTNKNIVIDDSSAQTISAIKTFSVSPLVPTTPSGASAAVAKVYVDSLRTVYDKVIRTQAEFNALIASATWLDAKSVAFIGDGGELKFTHNGAIKVPFNVLRIDGFNQAKLIITNVVIDLDTYKAALYVSRDDAKISNLRIYSESTTGRHTGVLCNKCEDIRLTVKRSDTSKECIYFLGNHYDNSSFINCVAYDAWHDDTITNPSGNNVFQFSNCDNLVTCNGLSDVSTGFANCTNLMVCKTSATAIGYLNCSYGTCCRAGDATTPNSGCTKWDTDTCD